MKVCLVTGGTRGIGLGVARALRWDGWELVLPGRRPGRAIREVKDELHAVYIPADLSRSEERARLIEEIRTRYGALHALVNNAGRAPSVRADLLQASEESFDEVLRTNLYGPYFLTQSLAVDMLERRRTNASFAPAIVFVTSVSAEMASPNRGEYCVSKAGLSMAARLFALRLAPHGIPVYEVRPGIIQTEMTAGVKDVYDRRIAEGLIPEGRWGQPEDLGKAVAALLRGDVPHASGAVIHVDGGLSLPRL